MKHIVSVESSRARPGSAEGRMRSNCCVIAVIRLARVRSVFSNVITFHTVRMRLFTVHLEYYATKAGTVLFGGAVIRHSSSEHIH